MHERAKEHAKNLGWEMGKMFRDSTHERNEIVFASMKASAGYKEKK